MLHLGVMETRPGSSVGQEQAKVMDSGNVEVKS